MRNFLFALFLLPAVSFAGSQLGSLTVFGPTSLTTVTVSQTLSMTSPSALISGTGPTATISMTNGYFANVSGSLVTAGSITIAGTPPLLPVASGVISYNGSGCTVTKNRLNFASCQRVSQGEYGVSFTTPIASANFQPICGSDGAGNSSYWVAGLQDTSNTTAGFRFRNLTISAGTVALADGNRIDCVVYP